MRLILLIAFFFSGAAGLVYESIWSRYLGLFLGHGAYAQVVVLVVFLGGLALGSLLVGERSEKVRHPLLWYAVVELAVGAFGLAFHDLYGVLERFAFGTVLPPLADGPLLTPVRWALAGALILPPSILLGTTFPMMSAALIRMRPAQPGRTLALLYFSNSFGAAVGVLVAGFVLLAWGGLPGTLLVAATLNVSVALVAWVAWRVDSGSAEQVGPAAAPAPASRTPEGAALWRLLLAVAFGTAVASFMYEIAWIRMLTLVLGAATHSFEIMLSAFILGLAFGSFWIRTRADTFRDPVRALGLIQWLMGLFAIATLPLYAESFGWAEWLLSALLPSDSGYAVFTLSRYGLSLAIMLPATFCAGMTLPLITRVLMAGSGERAIGWVYGLNTLGSIVGVALASLVLMPLVGVKALLVIGAGLDMLLGVGLLAWGRGAGSGRLAGRALLAGTLAAVAFSFVPLDKSVMSSSVFRRRPVSEGDEVLFWKDGRTATVSVTLRGDRLSIATNGKADGSLSRAWVEPRDEPPTTLVGDEPTQTLLALVTLAHRPDARVGAVVGQGTGMSSHFLLGSPYLESLATIEIEPAMIEGSRAFYPANRRVFDDPRSRFIVDDARSYLSVSGQRFDLILSEPSNPWVSGVAGLFTEEFYAVVASRLAEGGVFGQWVQLYGIDDGLIVSVLAALQRHFPSYALFRIAGGDMLIVATPGPTLPVADWSVFSYPGVGEDLERTHPFTQEALDRLVFMNERALGPLVGDWPFPNSDYYPILDLSGERARFLTRTPQGFLAASGGGFDPADPFIEPLSSLDPRGFPIPIEGLPTMSRLATTSELRRALENGALPDSTGRDEVLGPYRATRRFLADVERGDPPIDWPSWTSEALAIEAWLHDGLTGASFPGFFPSVERYLEVTGAPTGPRAALAFMQALRARDWGAVATLTDLLVDEQRTGRSWLTPALLLDAGVSAKLAVGDGPGARRVYDAIESRAGRASGDVRARLLRAFLGLEAPDIDPTRSEQEEP